MNIMDGNLTYVMTTFIPTHYMKPCATSVSYTATYFPILAVCVHMYRDSRCCWSLSEYAYCCCRYWCRLLTGCLVMLAIAQPIANSRARHKVWKQNHGQGRSPLMSSCCNGCEESSLYGQQENNI